MQTPKKKKDMKKYRHTAFQKGWWACFIAMAEVGGYYANGLDKMIRETLDSAGVTINELEYVMSHESISDAELKEILKSYLETLKEK